MHKKIVIALAMLSFIAHPMAGVVQAADNKTLCLQDPVCSELVQKNSGVLMLYEKHIKLLYQHHGRLFGVYNKKKAAFDKNTELQIKQKLNQLYGKILEADDWTWALTNDMNTAMDNYDADELGDIWNAIYDPRYEINAAYKMVKELKGMLSVP
ncbi:hypothetical protein HYY69_01620 [Candidatus Woesearchaeota archaeon]|nr:hypothetical protein [Candidatus Woesearchaeota archaeon]